MQPVTRRQFCRITSLSTLAWMASNHFGLADQINPAQKKTQIGRASCRERV